MNKKILILDIDYCLNYEKPSFILDKAQEIVKKDPYGKAVWELFRASAEDQKVRPQAIPYIFFNSFKEQFKEIVVITSRLESWREPTEAWLKRNNFHVNNVYMRPDDQYNLPGEEIKKNILINHILPFYLPSECVACDDDEKICKMYRSLGITIYQTPLEWDAFLSELKLK